MLKYLEVTLHPTIFWEMVKFVDLGVLYLSLVLPRKSRWPSGGPEWTLRSGREERKVMPAVWRELMMGLVVMMMFITREKVGFIVISRDCCDR